MSALLNSVVGVLHEHDVTFANRSLLPSQRLVTFDGAALGTASYGPRWRNLRRIALVQVQLLSARRVGCMSGVIYHEVLAMVRRMHRATTTGGAVGVELKRRLFELSLSVLMKAMSEGITLIQWFHWNRVDGVEVEMSERSGLTMPKAVPLEPLCSTREAMYDVLQKL